MLLDEEETREQEQEVVSVTPALQVAHRVYVSHY